MEQHTDGLKHITEVDTALAKESGETRDASDAVTVTINAHTYSGDDNDVCELVRQVLPQAQLIDESSVYQSRLDVVVHYTQSRCTFPTIAAAREACRALENRAGIRIEAPLTLREEELRALATFHAYRVLYDDWFEFIRRDHEVMVDRWHHKERLAEIARILGKEAVNTIEEEMSRAVSVRFAEAEEDRRLQRSSPHRHEAMSSKRSASGRTTQTRMRRHAKAKQP